MNTTAIVILVVVVIVVIVVLSNRRQVKELNENLRFIINSINENPEILLQMSYNDLVELEEVLNYFYNQGQALVSKPIYDRVKVELSKKK
jgi:hypothetical protein